MHSLTHQDAEEILKLPMKKKRGLSILPARDLLIMAMLLKHGPMHN